MENRDVLLQLASRADNSVLELLSKTAVWNDMSQVVQTQYFWYLRTKNLLSADLKQRPYEDWKSAYYALTSIVDPEYPYIEDVIANKLAMEILLELGYDPSVGDNYVLKIAAYEGYPETVKLLLADERVDPTAEDNYALKSAARNDHSEVVKLLLADRRIDPAANNDAFFREVHGRVPARILDILLDDPRIDKSGQVVIEEINRTSGRHSTLVLPSMYLDFNKLSPEVLRNIVTSSYYISSSINKAISLGNSSETRESIQERMINPQSLYDMLLREIILKRRDFDYYSEWLDKQDKSPEEKEVLKMAYKSAQSGEPAVHTSDLFTVYRGFFLIPYADEAQEGEDLTYTLSIEEGVTQEGLDLAGTLIGAFVGRRRRTHY